MVERNKKLFFVILLLVFSIFFILNFVSATQTQCWIYEGNQDSCEANSDCQWESDDWGGGWCMERGCWNYSKSF